MEIRTISRDEYTHAKAHGYAGTKGSLDDPGWPGTHWIMENEGGSTLALIAVNIANKGK